MNETAALASELLAAWDHNRCIGLPSARAGGFTLPQAFAVGADLRQRRIARGERPLGWKIGFTNRSIWARYGVFGPIWGPVWDSTVQQLGTTQATLSLAGLNQPRLEPEVVFGFATTPRAGLSLQELQACIAWVAHGFEVVHTHFEGWRFQAADCLADFALHGRLVIGPQVPVQGWATLAQDLAAMRVELFCDGVKKDEGQGQVVLDGPLHALKTWIDAMAEQSPQWQVQAGEIVTTGTITDAWPLVAGQYWHSTLSEPRLSALTLKVEA
jgi:2-oxo-3-hexenedioate decarboxylase